MKEIPTMYANNARCILHASPNTPQDVVDTLHRLYREGKRARIYMGDTQTGRDWGTGDAHKHDGSTETGRVSSSTGHKPIFIVVHNRRSMGGPALLTDCIVKIEYANKKDGGILYKHPTYHRNAE